MNHCPSPSSLSMVTPGTRYILARTTSQLFVWTLDIDMDCFFLPVTNVFQCLVKILCVMVFASAKSSHPYFYFSQTMSRRKISKGKFYDLDKKRSYFLCSCSSEKGKRGHNFLRALFVFSWRHVLKHLLCPPKHKKRYCQKAKMIKLFPGLVVSGNPLKRH